MSKPASLGDQQRVVAGPRVLVVGEDAPHLCSRADVVAAALEAEAVLVRHESAGLDAQQGVVGLGLVGMGVVAVVGRQQRSADPLGDVHQVGHDLALPSDPVVHQLDVEVLLAEDVLVPGSRRHRRVEVPG